MRATTAQRMLIGLGVFLVAGTGLLFLTGNREAGQVAREMFVLVVIVGGTFWLGFRFRVLPRRDSFRGQTEALAFTPQVGDPLGLLDLPFAVFHWAGIGAADREHRHRLARRPGDRDRRLLVRADRG